MLTIVRGDHYLSDTQIDTYVAFVNKQLQAYNLSVKGVEIMVVVSRSPTQYTFHTTGLWSNDAKTQFILDLHTERKLKQLLTADVEFL